MVNKNIIRKGVACLLSAAMVISGVAVAPASSKRVSAADASSIKIITDTTEEGYIDVVDASAGWWSGHSNYYKVSGDFDVTFTLTQDTAPITKNYYTPTLAITSDADRGAAGYTEYLMRRTDNWVAAVNEKGDNQTGNGVEVAKTSGFNWDTFLTDMAGATHVVNAKRNGDDFIITDMIKKADGTRMTDYVVSFTDPGIPSDLRLFWTGDTEKYTITSYKKTEVITTSTDKDYTDVVDASFGWWTAFSNYYKVSEDFDVTFTLTQDAAPITANYNTPTLAITSDAARGAAGYTEYLMRRTDHFTGAVNGKKDNQTGNGVEVTKTSGFNWDTFLTDMAGATHVVNVKRDGDAFVITDEITKADGVAMTDYVVSFTDPDIPRDLRLFWTGDTEKYTISSYVVNGEEPVVPTEEPSLPTEEPEPTDEPTPEPTKIPASITLNSQSVSMEIGDTYTLTAKVTPEDSGVTWTSSDASVATVDANGKVTAIKAGVATITATSKDNANLSAKCTVIVNVQIDTNLTDESQLGTSGSTTVYDRVTVHDPSIIVGYYEGTYSSATKVYGVQNAAKTRKEIYFVFGSHMAWAYSFDLKNWKTFTNNINTNYNTIFATDAEWSAHGGTQSSTTGKYEVVGNLWAPDIVWNPTMNKWCMYMSVNGDYWYTTVVLLTADSLNGSWTRVGPVVYSGFTKATDEWAKNQTDLFKVVGGSAIPDRYRRNRNGSTATYGMNAIDPCVLYDDDGSLWMVYGSWFGGLYMLKLDASTGLRDYTRTYETVANTSDAYQGIMLAGGDGRTGEAPYIQKINGKYYFFISYGDFNSNGGYNMRVFSSDKITGPYKDLSGEDARYGSTIDSTAITPVSADAGEVTLRKTTGSQLMNYYRWGFMNTGFTAEGHNSAFVDDDGKAYVVYHTRFDDGTEGHQVRVHQLFQAKNNGLVSAPFEYSGETLSDTAYSASKIAGEYNVILQQPTDFKNRECNTDKKLTLNADGTVTGAYGSGTWEQANDGPYATISIGGNTYKGVFLIQRMEETGNNAMCFTAVGNNDLALWGYKPEDPTVAISETIEQLNKLIPASTAVDIALPAEGVYGATVSWKSNGIAMADSGVVNPLKNDMDVVMTATITSGKYTFSKDYTIKVLGTDSVKTDTEVELKSYYTNTALDISALSENNYVQLDNPFYNTLADISNGAVISFDVTRKGNSGHLSNLLSLTGTSGRLYFTGGSYLGYNGPGGFYDANLNANYVAGTDLLATNQSVNIKLKFTSDGFEVYKNGTLAYSQSTLAAGTTSGGYTDNVNWSTINNSLMDWLKNGAPYLNFGYGNWWGDQIFNGTISNVKFSYVQKAVDLTENSSSLVGLYTQDYEKVANVSGEWTSPSESGQLKLSEDSEHGKFFLFGSPTGSGNRSAYNLFGTKVAWPDNYQIDFDLGLKSGNVANRSESQFAIASATSFTANEATANDNCILSLNCPQQTSDGVTTTWQINGNADNTITIPSADTTAGGWVHVTLKGNKTSGAGTLTITSGNEPIYNDAVTVPTGKVPTGFYVLNGRGSGLTKVDNIVVKEQGTDYANLSAYNNVLERANKYKAMQAETPVFTEASFNALTSAIATAESTVLPSLTSAQQNIVDAQVTALANAIDGLALRGYTVTIGTAANGTVEGLAAGGSYSAGTSVSLTAKPNSGYAFGGWKLGTDNTVVSKNTSYSAMVTGDITITPVFVKGADLTEFNEILASAEKIIAEQSASQVYTEDTFSVLQQAVITARVAVPSTLSEEDQSVVAAQIEALKAAISGLKKNGSANSTSPENPDGTSPTSAPNSTPPGGNAGNTGSTGGNTGSTGGNTGSTGGNTGSSGGNSGSTGGVTDNPGTGDSSQNTTPPATPNPTKEPTATVTPPVTGTSDPASTASSPTPSGDNTDDIGNNTANPTPTPEAPDDGKSDNSDDNKNSISKSDVSGYNKNRFDITSTEDRTTSYKKPPVNAGSKVKIPATVKVTENGKKVTYKVTSIKKNAFKGNKKVKQIIVGKNIKTIGKNAFKNCSKMKKMKVKTKSIKKVGKNAFKGVSTKCVIEVPKSKKKAYTKIFRKAGLSKKVKVVGK